MTKDVVIVGNTEFSRNMRYFLEREDSKTGQRWNVVAYSVDKEFISGKFFDDRPIVDINELLTLYPPDRFDVLIAIGSAQMGELRQSLFSRVKNLGYKILSYVHHTAFIAGNSTIGEGCIILPYVYIGPNCSIGTGVLLWDHVECGHDNRIGDYSTFSGNAVLGGNAVVGNHCYVGLAATIFNSAVVEDYALIGACAHVRRKVSKSRVLVPPQSNILKNVTSRDFKV